MAREDERVKRQAEVKKFLRPEPKALTDEAVERELKRVRPEFNFSTDDLRRLGRPKRGRAA
jgi:hypothetical protein